MLSGSWPRGAAKVLTVLNKIMAPEEVQVRIFGTREYVKLRVMLHVMFHVNVIQPIRCAGKNKMYTCVTGCKI